MSLLHSIFYPTVDHPDAIPGNPTLGWTEFLPYMWSLTDLHQWGFGVCDVKDLWLSFAFFIPMIAIRYVIIYKLAPRLAVFSGCKRRLHTRFAIQIWQFAYYTSSVLCGLYLFWDEKWLTLFQSANHRLHLGMPRNFYPSTPNYRVYYSYQLAYFYSELFYMFFEPRRSDFAEYVAHHLTTITLMYGSWASGEMRIGAYVALIHDPSDVFLSLAKTFNYLKAIPEWVTNTVFGLFVVTFFGLRLGCLPGVSYLIFIEGPYYLHKGEINIKYWLLALLLGVALQALQVFWGFLTARMIYRILIGKREDVRSDVSGEDEDEAAAAPTRKSRSGSGISRSSSRLSNGKMVEDDAVRRSGTQVPPPPTQPARRTRTGSNITGSRSKTRTRSGGGTKSPRKRSPRKR